LYESALKRFFATKLSLEIDVIEPTEALNFAVIPIRKCMKRLTFIGTALAISTLPAWAAAGVADNLIEVD